MMDAPFRYRICGLEMSSDFELPEAAPGDGGPVDVAIRAGPVPSLGRSGDAFQSYAITEAGDLIEYRDTTRFLVRGGDEITAFREERFDPRLMGLPILGAVFALLMHRRGQFVLHGSAVEIGGVAHVFLGDKGAGKSTTAASLVAAGHRLVADDVVVVGEAPDGRGLVVYPGYPSMKLDREMLPRFTPGSCEILQPDKGAYTAGKTRLRFCRAFDTDPLPLGPLHWLVRGDGHGFQPFDRAATLRTLIRFSYYPRFGGDAVGPKEAASLFARATALAARVECGRLTVRNGLQHIASLAAFLAEEEADGCFAG